MNTVNGIVIICLIIMLGIGTASALTLNITSISDANVIIKPSNDSNGEYEPLIVNMLSGETRQVTFNYVVVTPTPTPSPTPSPTPTPIVVPQNIIVNGDFSSGKTNWAFYTNGAGSFDAANSYATVSITKTGTNTQLLQNKLSLEAGNTYQLSFDAYSNSAHDIKIGMLKDVSPYTAYMPVYTVPLTTAWKTFTYKFNMTTTDPNIRFRFWFVPYAIAGDVYYFDNVKLEKITQSAPNNNTLQHPFLIINQSLYSELQAKQTQMPYNIWKSQAINELSLTYPTSGTIREKAEAIRDLSGSAALMYILDPVNKTTYATNFISGMSNWNDFNAMLAAETAPENIKCLSAGTAFFETTLGLDILYNELSNAQRTAIEAELQEMLPFIDRCGWMQNTYAVKGLWALYNGQDATGYINGYNAEMFRSISNTGVYVDGALYATSRMADPIKETKGYFLDIVEFTGKGSYYSNPRMQNFYEWMFGYTTLPNRNQSWVFGDALPETALNEGGAATYRAYRFSDKAAGYANWFIDNNYSTHTSAFLHYVLGKELPEALTPTSRVFSDGAAYFLEGNNNNKSLGGAINNIKADNFHSHYETNAIALMGYGETLMRGIGAAYGRLETSPDMKVNTVTRTQTAELGNTVTIDGVNHQQKFGAGITESLLTPEFDSVTGDSGSALTNGKHTRNFVFVHPQNSQNGYWIMFDEINAINGNTANVILHPNSDQVEIKNENMEYTWKINKNLVYDKDVYLTIFLGTEPSVVTIKDGLMASDLDYNFFSKYLNSTYVLNSNKKNVVTVLYPSDMIHQKANMTRIYGTGYSGATINNDVALESNGTNTITYNDITFNGNALWYNDNSYFMKGNLYSRQGVGFSSNNDVSLYMNNNKGKIVSDGAIATFTYPGITSIKVDGIEQPIISSEVNKVTVSIGFGTHDIELN